MQRKNVFTFSLLMAVLLSACGSGQTISAPAESVSSPEITAARPATTAPSPALAPTPEPTPLPLPERTVVPLDEKSDDAFVRVLDYIPNIYVELQYATPGNFTRQRIYPFEYSEAYLRCGTVKKLMKAEEKAEAAGYRLKIWDAFRPVSAQFRLWEIVPDPVYVANPNNGYSSHSRGNTVDITLVYEDGSRVTMPTGFDDFTTKADRDYSDCTAEERENALLLQNLMVECGFAPYQGEWWHFADVVSYQAGEGFEPPEMAFESRLGEEAVSVELRTFALGKRNLMGLSVSGLSAQREVVWRYDTEVNTAGQGRPFDGIEAEGGNYYLHTLTSIRAIRVSDGKILWTNLDFGGPFLTTYAFDDSGRLYAGGWEATDLMVVDTDGSTLAYIDLPDYFGPRIELEDTRAKITFEYVSDDSDNVVYVDLGDYSVILPEGRPADGAAVPISGAQTGGYGRQIEAQ